MRCSEVANRYAMAIFQLAQEGHAVDGFLSALKTIKEAIEADTLLTEFVNSPLIPAIEKEKLFKKTLSDKKVAEEIVNFVALLARKGRLAVLSEVIEAYQACDDREKMITRGAVRSATKLDDKQKSEIATTIAMITKKKVLLTFAEDKSLIGGLVAQVGSLTFDDTLTSHIRRIKEDLNRRVH